jgi:hypothetical protein
VTPSRPSSGPAPSPPGPAGHPSPKLRAWASAGLLLLGAACGPSKDEVERKNIAERIDALRSIPAEDTSARARSADELSRAPATGTLAIAARDLCAKAFGTLAEGMRLTSLAERGVRSASSADDVATLRATAAANRLLTSSDALLDQCADASAALRVRGDGTEQ